MTRGNRRREESKGVGGAVVYVVAQDTGRVLLGLRSSWLKNRPLTWAPFGGGIEGDETPAECALRELKEETGYSGPIALFPVKRRVFLGLVPEEFPPLLNNEHIHAKWFDPEELG